MPETLILASRGSALALAQTQTVVDALLAAWPGLDVAVEVVRTRGDDNSTAAAEEMGAGAFVSEVQVAVLSGRAHAAVHSYKDLPTAATEGLEVAAVPARQDPRDALVSRRGVAMAYLDNGARVGTGSRRRAAQLRRRRSDLEILPIRGNVDTRLRRLEEGDLDAVVLAAAGLIRLGLDDRITEAFDVDVMVPAAGQGALAVEARSADAETVALLAALTHGDSLFEVAAERACLARLGVGCNAPVGIHCTAAGDDMRMEGIVLEEGGRKAARVQWRGPRHDGAEEAGETLAELLIETGARNLLAEAAQSW